MNYNINNLDGNKPVLALSISYDSSCRHPSERFIIHISKTSILGISASTDT